MAPGTVLLKNVRMYRLLARTTCVPRPDEHSPAGPPIDALTLFSGGPYTAMYRFLLQIEHAHFRDFIA